MKVLLSVLFAVSFSVLLGSQNAFAETTMTVNSDQPCYVKRDTVTVSGSVSEVIPDTLVGIQIVSNIGNLVVLAELEVAPGSVLS